MALCIVYLSVASRSSVETSAGRIELVLGMDATFNRSKEIHVSTNKDTSRYNFVLNTGLRKFRHGTSIVAFITELNKSGCSA